MDKTPRYVIVELYDDAPNHPQTVAEGIVRLCVEDVKEARPAYEDGFGRFVMVGNPVTEEVRFTC